MFDVLNKTVDGIDPRLKNVGTVDSIYEIVNIIINILLGVTFALSIVGIAYSFFLFVVSAGDKDAVKKAKTSLTWSVIVLILCFVVISLKNILFNLLGVTSQFNPTGAPGGGGVPPLWHPI
jgi:O-antigen/teichoic acid export membrane protein